MNNNIAEYAYTLRPYALHLCKNDVYKADELVQDTCDKVLRKFGRYAHKPQDEQERMVNVTMRNIFIDRVRSENLRPKVISSDAFDFELTNDVVEEDLYTPRLRVIMDYIKTLDEPAAKCFLLWLNGKKLREVCVIMNIKLGTACRYNYNMVKMLKNKFGGLRK